MSLGTPENSAIQKLSIIVIIKRAETVQQSRRGSWRKGWDVAGKLSVNMTLISEFSAGGQNIIFKSVSLGLIDLNISDVLAPH